MISSVMKKFFGRKTAVPEQETAGKLTKSSNLQERGVQAQSHLPSHHQKTQIAQQSIEKETNEESNESNIRFFSLKSEEDQVEEIPIHIIKKVKPRESKGVEEVKGIIYIIEGSNEASHIEVVDKEKLMFNTIPPGIELVCTISHSSYLTNPINPEFDLALSNGMKHIASAKKYSLSNKQIYRFSTQQGCFEECTHAFLGSLYTNELHNFFCLGKPFESVSKQIQSNYRHICALIIYKKRVKNEQRKMKIVLEHNETPFKYGMSKKMNIIKPSSIFNKFEGLELSNKPSKDFEFNSKNFILIDSEDDEYDYLSMSKLENNRYQLRVRHPLTPLQAFAIALTRFDAQL